MLVDHHPAGVKGELHKTLSWLKQHNPQCRVLLGLRDIIDEPEAVLATWRTEMIHEVLDSLYDQIFIYGAPEFFDPVSEYNFGASARCKTSYTGFITDLDAESTCFADEGRRREVKELFLTVGASRYPYPEGVDFVKLPAVVKTGANIYQAGPLGISFTETLELRQNLIYEAVKTFRPQLMLVDHSPVGVKGELHKTFSWLKQHRPV